MNTNRTKEVIAIVILVFMFSSFIYKIGQYTERKKIENEISEKIAAEQDSVIKCLYEIDTLK